LLLLASPLQDIVEGKDSFTIHADAPGFTPEDISVEMNEGTLTISGKRQDEKTEEHEGKVSTLLYTLGGAGGGMLEEGKRRGEGAGYQTPGLGRMVCIQPLSSQSGRSHQYRLRAS
jgi:hypothetical protein